VAYAEYRPIDPNELHEAAALGSGIFPTVAYWEREYGYSLFDEETIGPGYILSARFGPQVLIDEQHDKVYVYASHPFGGTAGKSATAAEAHDGNRETGGNRGQSRMAVP